MRGYGITDRGMVRKENQDSFRLAMIEDQDCAVLVLCDGMGGAQAGSVASRMAVESFMTHALSCLQLRDVSCELDAAVRDATAYANIKVYDRSFVDFGCMGMGTTLVAAIIRGEEALVVNVGDSRALLFSNGIAAQITRDHSLVEDMIQQGAITRTAARRHPRRNVITRALGVEQTVKCDVFRPELRPGDVLLLCSDGLSNLVEEGEMLSTLEAYGEPEPFCSSPSPGARRIM